MAGGIPALPHWSAAYLRHAHSVELDMSGGLLDKLNSSLSGKLYGIALVSILAVLTLVLSSLFFADATKQSARSLYERGFVGSQNATQLELLLEQHRRLVEGAPSEVVREQLRKDRQEVTSIEAHLRSLLKDLELPDLDRNAPEFKIGNGFTQLFTAGEKVFYFASEFAQDKAVEYANDYAGLADDIQRQVKELRAERLQHAKDLIASVMTSATRLTIWVLLGGVAALFFIGPIGLATTRGVLVRIRAITKAMVLLAGHNNRTRVPSVYDRDEVGEMARAVEVFKENALQLAERELELKQLHDRIDSALNNMTHGLCMFDADQRLIVCNDIYSQMYALPLELTRPGTSLQRIESYRSAMGTGVSGRPDGDDPSTKAKPMSRR